MNELIDPLLRTNDDTRAVHPQTAGYFRDLVGPKGPQLSERRTLGLPVKLQGRIKAQFPQNADIAVALATINAFNLNDAVNTCTPDKMTPVVEAFYNAREAILDQLHLKEERAVEKIGRSMHDGLQWLARKTHLMRQVKITPSAYTRALELETLQPPELAKFSEKDIARLNNPKARKQIAGNLQELEDIRSTKEELEKHLHGYVEMCGGPGRGRGR